MDAKAPTVRDEYITPLSDGRFATDRTWMPMSEEQLRRSMYWLFEEIRLTLKKETGTELKICGMSADLKKFDGARSLLWTYRPNGVGSDRTMRVHYLVYEMGKRGNVLLEGDLTFRPESDYE